MAREIEGRIMQQQQQQHQTEAATLLFSHYVLRIFFFFFFFFFLMMMTCSTLPTLVLSHQHYPNPEYVVQQVQRRVNESVTTRRYLQSQSPCLTGNPIDDCWRCDQNWGNNRQQLANCGIGFGEKAMGGKGGPIYWVSDSSDDAPATEPKPGTLRFGAIQEGPLWITFQESMTIKLEHELLVGSSKTIDGRGATVRVTGKGCIVLRSVTNVIITNLQIYDCVPSDDKDKVGLTPTKSEPVSRSDGDGISVQMSTDVWIDHCTLAHCTDGLIDVTEGSTAVTISNNFFSNHDKVMLLGHSDDYAPDDNMRVTVAFNRFSENLVQRMPRCRRGYFHILNNDYTGWGLYAIGGSGAPTINSQNNRFAAPPNPKLKEVTRREDTEEKVWLGWNWRSTGDVLLNDAVFVPSGTIEPDAYTMASSFQPTSSTYNDQLTQNAGALTSSQGGGTLNGGGGVSNIPGSDQWGYQFQGGAPPRSLSFGHFFCLLCSLLFVASGGGALN